MHVARVIYFAVSLCFLVNPSITTFAQSAIDARPARKQTDSEPHDVMADEDWKRVDDAVERALSWLATQQQPDGSFPTLRHGQPGVTSLCLLAFMAHGHNPGEGQYGDRLARAESFILTCQKPNGLITLYGPDGPQITRGLIHEIGVSAAYNHAIASLALSEIYGMGQSQDAERLEQAIQRSLAAILEMQRWPKDKPLDHGGWRYVNNFDSSDSDLSITGWNLMFLRSARNAGFEVPKEAIDDAVHYIRQTYDKEAGVFGYTTVRGESFSRAMAGAGILALAHAGLHDSMEAQSSGQWLLDHDFEDYNRNDGLPLDRYHYSLFQASQAMYQLGAPYWDRFFPGVAATLVANQRPNGAWDAEGLQRDRPYGNCYTTALVVLSLGAPNQFLPIFQR